MDDRRSDRDLRARRAPIEMSGDEFRAAGHRLIDDVADYLDGLRRRPVTRASTPSRTRALLPPAPVPDDPAEPRALLEQTARLLFDHSLHNGHPRFFGYITSSAAPLGALADLLAAAVNPNLGGWQLSPLATEIERQAVSWIAELLGYPTTCGGLFVSGGNMANFAAFLAARQDRTGWDVRREGLGRDGARLRVYAGAETHVWVHKALDLFGHGTDALREVPVDSRLRTDPARLRAMVAEDRRAGLLPFLVIATAGTVSTGSVDPIREVTEFAHEQGLWLHVDGAYGAFAAALPDADDDLRALGRADSIAVDPHKWLYTPLEAGCLLVRDPAALPRAFAYRPAYYHFDESDEPETNYFEHGMQNSRGFRALKVWLALRQVGRRGVVRMIEDDVRLARAMHAAFDAHPEIEAGTLGLSIVTFRHVPRDLRKGDPAAEDYLDKLNEALLVRLKSSGEAFFSNAVVAGRFVLRACIVNFRTTLDDVEALPEMVARHGRAVDRELRTQSPST